MSMFDDDTTTQVRTHKKPKNKGTIKLQDISAVLKASGATVVPLDQQEEEKLTAEPGAQAKVRDRILKLVRTNQMIKKSQLIEAIITKLFPAAMEEETGETEVNAVYGMINLTLAELIQEGDVNEYRFVNSEGTVMETLVVTDTLSLLNGNLDFDELTAEEMDDVVGEVEPPDEASGLEMRQDDPDDQDIFGKVSPAPNTYENANTYESELKLLQRHVERFAVMTFGSDPAAHTVSVFNDGSAALADYSQKLQRTEAEAATIYGMIPVHVKVELDFESHTPNSVRLETHVESGTIHHDVAADLSSDGESELDLSSITTP